MYNVLRSEILLETCGKYTVLIFENPLNSTLLDYVLLTDLYPNGLSLFLQLIQIIVLTGGEVMFSISGNLKFENILINKYLKKLKNQYRNTTFLVPEV